MTALLLRLAGPLQSWGDASRFVRRETRPEPTKSGVLGLLAAAQGRRRTDSIADILQLSFGVRVDQPGRLVRDFHTARRPDGMSLPLSYRFYLADAVFVAAVEGDPAVLEGIDEAVRAPHWPLYLGRRSCPPEGPLSLGVRDGTVSQSLHDEPWHASPWWRRRSANLVLLDVLRDVNDAQEAGEVVRDEPMSFDPVRREYAWRTVVRDRQVTVDNPASQARGSPVPQLTHDPYDALGGL